MWVRMLGSSSILTSLLPLTFSSPLLPPLLLPSSHVPDLPYQSAEVETIRTSRQFSPHSSPPPNDSEHGGCRYCNLCQCQAPSDEEGHDLFLWIQQHFYAGKELDEDESDTDRRDEVVEPTEKMNRKINHKIRSEVPTSEDGEQDEKEDYVDLYMDNITLNNKDYEIKQRRDRLI